MPLIGLFKRFELSSEALDLFLKLLDFSGAEQVGSHADAFLWYIRIATG